MNLSLCLQLPMMPTLTPASKGAAGVPATLAILAGALSTFHLPMEGVAAVVAKRERAAAN